MPISSTSLIRTSIWLLCALTSWNTALSLPHDADFPYFNLTSTYEDDFSPPPDCEFLTVEEIYQAMDDLALNFPSICKKYVIGQSVGGRPLTVLKISDNVDIDEDEAEVLFDGAIHGDEDIPELFIIKLAREFCEQYGENDLITELINSREIWLAPLVCPDCATSPRSRLNENFIDVNRNWGYMWGEEAFDEVENYYSEPESRGFRDFFMDKNLSVYVSYHNGLSGIIYPWYYKETPCPDFDVVSSLAHQYLDVSSYDPDEFAVTSGAELYPSFGSSPEAFYGSSGTLAFAVELSQWNLTSCQALDYNLPSILMMTEKAGEGLTGNIVNQNTGQSIAASIFIDDRVPIYSTEANGDFHRYLLPGTYDLNIMANGYQSKQLLGVIVSEDLPTHIDVELEPSDKSGIHKIVACRNFNNLEDEAKTWNIIGTESDGQYYSLADSGWVVVDLLQPIINQSGNDLTVHEGDDGIEEEGYEVRASSSPYGPWTSLGHGLGTTSFDVNNVDQVRYLFIQDDANMVGLGANAGFDLDAVTTVSAMTSTTSLVEENSILVGPNPFSQIVSIKMDQSLGNSGFVEIINMAGQALSIKKLNPLQTEMSYNLDYLPDGAYIFRVTTSDRISSHKIVKIN